MGGGSIGRRSAACDEYAKKDLGEHDGGNSDAIELATRVRTRNSDDVRWQFDTEGQWVNEKMRQA